MVDWNHTELNQLINSSDSMMDFLEGLHFENRSVLVTGALGQTGSAMASLLSSLGATVYGVDQRPDDLPGGIIDVRGLSHSQFFDSHTIDAVLVSPGVPLTEALFQEARQRSIPLLGDLDLGYLYLKQKVKATTQKQAYIVAITGTDGKSTTTALVAHLLREAGLSALECGNFGLPFSKAVTEDVLVYVCECSSYQLEDIHYFRPDVAVVLNLAADHLDRYDSMADYVRAKLNLFSNQTVLDFAVIGPTVKEVSRSLDIFDFELPGKIQPTLHEVKTPPDESARLGNATLDWSKFAADTATNRKNAVMALKAIECLLKKMNEDRPGMSSDVFHERVLQGLKTFRGLPHRQEVVTERQGVVFVNDSKATTVHAALSAIASYNHKRIFLLLGGLDKNSDFSVLQESDQLRLYPFGRAADKIAAQTLVSRTFSTLEDAFYAAARDARRLTHYYAGQSESDCVLLLSPACASQDAYRNYKERGEHFRKLALAHAD